jgi:hypothetical protein
MREKNLSFTAQRYINVGSLGVAQDIVPEPISGRMCQGSQEFGPSTRSLSHTQCGRVVYPLEMVWPARQATFHACTKQEFSFVLEPPGCTVEHWHFGSKNPPKSFKSILLSCRTSEDEILRRECFALPTRRTTTTARVSSETRHRRKQSTMLRPRVLRLVTSHGCLEIWSILRHNRSLPRFLPTVSVDQGTRIKCETRDQRQYPSLLP